MQIVVNVTGLDNAKERLASLGTSLHDFTAAFKSLGAQLIMFYSDTNFNSSGSAIGAKWASLASSTQAEKDKDWPGRGILQRTGALQKGFYSKITPDSLYISNNVSYFPYHQLGTSGGRGRGHNIPARKMLGSSTAVDSMIKTMIQADIRAKIDASNG